MSECDRDVTNYEVVRQVRPSLFWDVARLRFVVSYGRFGTDETVELLPKRR